MRSRLGMWKCECCNLSNPEEFDRCSYCGLPALHTSQELEKYKQTLPSIKGFDKKVAVGKIVLLSIWHLFRTEPKFTLVMIIALLVVLPITKDHIQTLIPIALLLVILVWGYLYMKNK